MLGKYDYEVLECINKRVIMEECHKQPLQSIVIDRVESLKKLQKLETTSYTDNVEKNIMSRADPLQELNITCYVDNVEKIILPKYINIVEKIILPSYIIDPCMIKYTITDSTIKENKTIEPQLFKTYKEELSYFDENYYSFLQEHGYKNSYTVHKINEHSLILKFINVDNMFCLIYRYIKNSLIEYLVITTSHDKKFKDYYYLDNSIGDVMDTLNQINDENNSYNEKI